MMRILLYIITFPDGVGFVQNQFFVFVLWSTN